MNRTLRVVGWVVGMIAFGLLRGNLFDSGYLAFIGGVIIAGIIYISFEDRAEEVEGEIPLNREARRHPNGRVASQKFMRQNVRMGKRASKGRIFRGF